MLLIIGLLCLLGSGQAQEAQRVSALSIEQFMQGERFVGYLPEAPRWSEDSRTIYFSWNPDMDTLRQLYKVSAKAGASPLPVSVEEERALPGNGAYSRDYTRLVYEKNGDLFLLDIASGRARQITNTLGREHSPAFAQSDTKIAYVFDNNLYAWDIAAGMVEQLTDLRRGSKKKDANPSTQDQWLLDDQLALIETLRRRKTEREAQQARLEALKPQRPLELYYGNKRLFGLQASPDLRFVTFSLLSETENRNTKVPDYLAESGYTAELNARAKVGSPQPVYELGIYDRQRDTFYLLNLDGLEGIMAKPAFLQDYWRDTLPFQPQYDKPKPVSMGRPVFSNGGHAAMALRSQDNKDRWIVSLDLEKGALRQLDWQHDEAWIGGPGINFSNLGWIDEARLYFQSEATGYSHLYIYDFKTGEKKQLTQGNYEVLSVQLSRDKRWFYLNANAEGPHEQHFYRLPVGGGKPERLTTLPGRHEVSLSPDEKQLAIRFSASNQPWELYWMENKPGAPMQRLTRSTTPAFDAYPWRIPEIVYFEGRDGIQVPARLYRPANPQPGGPAVIFVHGAGYLQNVHRWWSSYYREYMFHHFLSDQGYTVLDIDYRGSAGYGRDWRTAIYRHMGGQDLDDQVDGAKFLAQQYGIDPGKIGIYGGSYGGFITLMALFTQPGVFASGAALRSVTDWAHYNHGYTSNILNTPAEDSIAFRRSSPIYFAEGLQDELLMLHGMVDVNVHFQDVVRLSQRLIELGKDNWEMAIYPMEDHGFIEASGWADEYKRIFNLFERTLRMESEK
jgi:dipeptidyl aminopeptidase/acylaminoacyl peptidase